MKPGYPSRRFWAGPGSLFFWLLVLLPCRAAEEPRLVVPDLAALNRLAQIQLPSAPQYPLNRSGGIWTIDQIAAQFERVTDRVPQINYTRSSFVRPAHHWLVAYDGWFMRMQKELDISYRDNVWDCEDFARCFVSFANMIALSGGETRGSICVGWATVANNRSFGGVSGSGVGGHAIVIVGTEEGLFVVEPQTGEMAALADYPNKGSIIEVYF